MKKILSIIFAMVLIVSMAAPAFAVTPGLEVPDVPEIPYIGDDITIEIPDEVFDEWFDEHPVPPLVPTEPVEPPVESVPGGWFDWLRGWLWWIP